MRIAKIHIKKKNFTVQTSILLELVRPPASHSLTKWVYVLGGGGGKRR